MKGKRAKQYHFTVPLNDTDVKEWISLQANLSVSVRMLIRESVKREGFVDVFCKPVQNLGIRPGRPAGTSEKNVEEIKKEENRADYTPDNSAVSDALASMFS